MIKTIAISLISVSLLGCGHQLEKLEIQKGAQYKLQRSALVWVWEGSNKTRSVGAPYWMFLCNPMLKDMPLKAMIGKVVMCDTGNASIIEVIEPGAIFTVTSIDIVSSGIDKPILEIMGTIKDHRGRFRLVDYGLNVNALDRTLGPSPAFEDYWKQTRQP
jgi:hypothetical protein